MSMGHQDHSEKSAAPQRTLPARSAEPGASAQRAVVEAVVEGELEQIKQQLFSALAHELRTPLASLRLAAGLLVSAPPAGATEEHRQLFQFILHSSDRLDLLISRLLDAARLEAHHLPLTLQVVDLRPILESVADRLAPQYRAKRQTLEVSLPAQPVTVAADPLRVTSALHALLETACQRCPEAGRLTLGCQAQAGDAVGWVGDSGPAVPAALRAQLLTPASGQTPADLPQLSAFGLGLPLAAGLLALQGGSLWLAEPEAADAGLCFRFRLPLAPP